MLQSFWLVAPVASLLFVLGLGVLLHQRVRSSGSGPFAGPLFRETGFWAGVFVLCVLAFPMVFPHWVNLRYVSPVFAPFYVVAGIGTWFLLELTRKLPGFGRKVGVFAGFGAIVLSAAADARCFERVVVQRGILDLSLRMLLEAEAFNSEIPLP